MIMPTSCDGPIDKLSHRAHGLSNMSLPHIVIVKFGGSSVSSAACWHTITTQIKRLLSHQQRPVIVCSALHGVSNHLAHLASLTRTRASSPMAAATAEFTSIHRRMCKSLNLPTSLVDSAVAELTRLTQLAADSSSPEQSHPALTAKIMALGEYTLTTIGHAYLTQQGLSSWLLDAGDWLHSPSQPPVALPYGLTDHYLNASCDYTYDPELNQQCLNSPAEVIITQGFIATDHRGDTVLLGRGGSDTSATYLAAKLGAAAVEIWTDVPGIFTANPQEIPDSRLLLQLSYDEAQELASSGAKVLHPRCIEPLATAQIPLSIHWTHHPHLDVSTTISADGHSGYNVKGICAKKDIYVFSMTSIKMWQQAGFLAEIFALFKQFHLSCDTVSTSESNITVTVNAAIQNLSADILSQLKERLSSICSLSVYSDCVSISLVGQGIRSILHRLAPMLKVFEDRKVFVVSQAANNLNFSFTVQRQDAPGILKQLHALLFSATTDPHLHIFGPTWQQLDQQAGQTPSPLQAATQSYLLWWQQHRTEIQAMLEPAATACTLPAYVYHLPTIRQRAAELSKLTAVSMKYYALKANPHPQIITTIADFGFGFDCVSYGEIAYLKDHLATFEPRRIIFTPNFAPITEYERALQDGVTVTVDNLELIKAHPEVFAGQTIMLRIDLGTRHGHHQYVKTAGDESKFGIPKDEWANLISLIQTHSIALKGLHAHQGSGIAAMSIWRDSAAALIELADTIPRNHRSWPSLLIDVGGGFPIPDHPEEHSTFCATTLNTELMILKARHPGYEFAIEPGRYLVAEAGIIVTEVHQVKTKHHRHYIGVDAGMHTLIRPSLYGAYHHISHLHPPDHQPDRELITADIVGPICESGDILAHERRILQARPHDLLVICGAGAYGRVMASHYNQRGLPEEYIIDKVGVHGAPTPA